MNRTIVRIVVVAIVIASAGGILYAKQRPVETPPTTEVTQANTESRLPKLLDLGADKCIPCKMMKPVLDELEKEFAGRMDVEFVDVWKNPDAAETYGVQAIPTQIFFDATGKEVARHEGFFSKDEILKTWADRGIEIRPSADAP